MVEWLSDNEKYALIGLRVKIEGDVPFAEVGPGLWVWTGHRLAIPAHWRDWLGTIRTEEIERCTLVLLAKAPTKNPHGLDGENQVLQRKVGAFYVGLLLSRRFTPADDPVALTGGQRGGEIDVMQEMTIDGPTGSTFGGYPSITNADVTLAAMLGENYLQLFTTPPPGGAWRLLRAVSVYVDARKTPEILDKIHQYCRCIDAVIFSEPGDGKSQFKSRTELFIGPRHHDLMGKLYSVRSDDEHLHEHKYLEVFDRGTRLDLMRQEAIAEHIARKTLAHVIATPSLWPHFANSAGLASFWGLPAPERRLLWGSAAVSPQDALSGYDPEFISDADLGA
jgi:hypothetical protein